MFPGTFELNPVESQLSSGEDRSKSQRRHSWRICFKGIDGGNACPCGCTKAEQYGPAERHLYAN